MAAARVRSGPAAGRGCVSFLLASLGLAALTTPAYAVEVATPWRFAGIGPSQTLLRIVANGGRCEAPGTPRVQETATTVRITAITVRPDQLASPCPAVIDADDVYVPLAKPLAGRKLLGASATAVTIARSERPPRVVGLSPGDAISVFGQTFNAEGTPFKPVFVRRSNDDGLRRVVSQNGVRIVVAGRSSP